MGSDVKSTKGISVKSALMVQKFVLHSILMLSAGGPLFKYLFLLFHYYYLRHETIPCHEMNRELIYIKYTHSSICQNNVYEKLNF